MVAYNRHASISNSFYVWNENEVHEVVFTLVYIFCIKQSELWEISRLAREYFRLHRRYYRFYSHSARLSPARHLRDHSLSADRSASADVDFTVSAGAAKVALDGRVFADGTAESVYSTKKWLRLLLAWLSIFRTSGSQLRTRIMTCRNCGAVPAAGAASTVAMSMTVAAATRKRWRKFLLANMLWAFGRENEIGKLQIRPGIQEFWGRSPMTIFFHRCVRGTKVERTIVGFFFRDVPQAHK